MGVTGFKTPSYSGENQEIPQGGAAESGAVLANTRFVLTPDELAQALLALSFEDRARLTRMLEAGG